MEANPAPSRPSRERILAAAEALLSRQSFGQTSLRQLMAEAGVSTTAFYARFESREAVLLALIERLLQALQEEARTALVPGRSPEQIIEHSVQGLVRSLAEHRAIVAIALSEGMAVPAIREALASAYRALARIISAGLPGIEDEREALAWAFVGALQIQITRWAVFRELETEDLAPTLSAVSHSLLASVQRKDS